MQLAGVILGALLLSACGIQSFQAGSVAQASFKERAQVQQRGTLQVSAAVPSATETRALFGIDLYADGIQPLWIEVSNTGPSAARIALWSIDRNYFSPIEVAYLKRRAFSAQGYRDMERWFRDHALPREVAPGQRVAGFVYTHLVPGTKGFNLDIFQHRQASSFTFFLNVPGFTADYQQVNFDSLYTPQQIVNLQSAQAQSVLESDVPCCSTDVSGEREGAAFNAMLVATPQALRVSLLRAGWLDTARDDPQVIRAREHYYDGRPPDAVFFQNRKDGNERVQLHLWMTHWQIEQAPVWLAQVYYRSNDTALVEALGGSQALADSKLLSQFVGESVSADIDSARQFLTQSFWYNHSLQTVTLLAGIGARPIDQPARSFDRVGYFTDGLRALLFLSETPVAIDDAVLLFNDNVKQRLEVSP